MSKRLKLAKELSKQVYPAYKVLQAVNSILRRTIEEEVAKESGGYRGDGASDPENLQRRNRPMTWEEITSSLNKYLPQLENIAGEEDIAFDCIELVQLAGLIYNDADISKLKNDEGDEPVAVVEEKDCETCLIRNNCPQYLEDTEDDKKESEEDAALTTFIILKQLGLI